MVYHIGTFGNWSQVVDEQMLVLRISGLYEKLDAIYVGAHGPDCNALITEKFKDDTKVFVAVTEEIEKTYENKTINKLLEIAHENPEAYILYIHSKGVTLKNQIQVPWRHYMMEKMVKNHDVCINLMDKGYETVGSMILLNEYFFGFPHYSGNFFWTTSKYATSLEPITKLSVRHEAERWILSKMIPKAHISLGPVWFNIPVKLLSPKYFYKRYMTDIDIVYKI
jgi:hypothetical protein